MHVCSDACRWQDLSSHVQVASRHPLPAAVHTTVHVLYNWRVESVLVAYAVWLCAVQQRTIHVLRRIRAIPKPAAPTVAVAASVVTLGTLLRHCPDGSRSCSGTASSGATSQHQLTLGRTTVPCPVDYSKCCSSLMVVCSPRQALLKLVSVYAGVSFRASCEVED